MTPFIALAVLLGIAVTLQGTTNGQLAGRLGVPLTLSINSGLVFAGSLAWLVIARLGASEAGERLTAPWYLFTGGLFGLAIITCATLAYPKLGAGATTTIAVASQVLTALALDHFGATGRVVPISLARVLGLVLVIAGTWLFVASSKR